MINNGGFDHQRQTMRILEKLEKRYPDFDGLNLTYEVREGVVKHDTDYDVQDARGYQPDLSGTIECQLSNLADEIAYSTSDLDDGLRAGLLSMQEVQHLSLWQLAASSLNEPIPSTLDNLYRHRVIRRIVGTFIKNVIDTTEQEIRRKNIQSVQQLRLAGTNLANYEADFGTKNRELKRFLMEYFYRHHRVMRMVTKAQRVLSNLFDAYLSEPLQLPTNIRGKIATEPEGLHRVICDYIAGMTDRYALEEHARLFDPTVNV